MDINSIIKLKKNRIKKYNQLIKINIGYMPLLEKCIKDLNRLQYLKGSNQNV